MTIEVHGHCDSDFLPLRDAFVQNFEDGLELGAALAVTHHGQFVCDIWAGDANIKGTRQWQRDSVVIVFSTTKIMTTLCALLLIDRGQLDLDAPIAQYWPEFGQAGKATIPVRYLFDHSAGLPGWNTDITFEELCDWDHVVGLLAAQAPWWEPGTETGYHMHTYGFLVGELVRRITGVSIGTFLRREICEPLGADFHIGLPPDARPRLAQPSYRSARAVEDLGAESEIAAKVTKNPTTLQLWHTPAALASEVPSANGHGNARSIARIGTVLVNGGTVDGRRYLRPATVELALTELSYRKDIVLGEDFRWGLGLALNSAEMPFPNPHVAHFGGYGGSLCFMDCDAGSCCAYTPNEMRTELLGDPRNLRIRDAWTSCL